MNVLESDPNRREIKELVEDLKETEQKLESICCDIQTSLQDQAHLDQLDEWLAKLTVDSLEVRAEAAKYLEESSSRSSSSSSHKNTRSYQRKPRDAKNPETELSLAECSWNGTSNNRYPSQRKWCMQGGK